MSTRASATKKGSTKVPSALRIEGGAIGLASPVFSSRSNPFARRRLGRFLVVFLALLWRARDFVDALALTLAEDEDDEEEDEDDDERAAAHRDGASSETADAIVLSFLARARIFVGSFCHSLKIKFKVVGFS